jgi:hypothetical protein
LNPKQAEQAAQFNALLAQLRQQGFMNRRNVDTQFLGNNMNLYGIENQLDQQNKPFTLGDALPMLAGTLAGAATTAFAGPAAGLAVGSGVAKGLG